MIEPRNRSAREPVNAGVEATTGIEPVGHSARLINTCSLVSRSPDARAIPLNGRAGIKGYAYVDQEDYASLSRRPWFLHHSGYVQGRLTVDGPMVLLHRVILGVLDQPRVQVDHIDEDKLNNRRANLRLATGAQNAQNRRRPHRDGTSGYRGVSYHAPTGKWRGVCKVGGKKCSAGYFDSAEAANEALVALRARVMPFSADARASTNLEAAGVSPLAERTDT